VSWDFVVTQDTGGFQNFVERTIGVVELRAGRHAPSVKPLTKPGLAGDGPEAGDVKAACRG
jgi:hypothetical protein